MRSPECPDCGSTDGLCRDVSPGTNPRLVWREIKCVNCGAKRKAFMGYLPDELQDVTMKELSEDRLISSRTAAYRRRGKGVYRRTDTLRPARVSLWVQVARRGRRVPRVGAAGWNARGTVETGSGDSRSAVNVMDAPLFSEDEHDSAA